MIPVEILLSPLAIAGFLTGLVVGFLAGRVRSDEPTVIVMSAFGSGIALAGLAWANAFGGGPLFAAAAVGRAPACGPSAPSARTARPSVDDRGMIGPTSRSVRGCRRR